MSRRLYDDYVEKAKNGKNHANSNFHFHAEVKEIPAAIFKLVLHQNQILKSEIYFSFHLMNKETIQNSS